MELLEHANELSSFALVASFVVIVVVLVLVKLGIIG